MSLARLAALAWTAANGPAYWRYRAALRHPQAVQEGILQRYLRRNAATAFGEAHGFASIRGAAQFQQRVPLARWSDVAPWVERIAAGEAAVLTRGRVRVLESTGGTTAAKRIPYTSDLQREVRRAVAPWIFDLGRRDPRLLLGRAYWAITPVMQAPAATGPVRQGFEEDGEYLGGWWRRLVDATLAVPAAVRHVPDVESFRYVTLLFLLLARDLALVSVWHPSFLSLLLEALPRHWDSLLEDVERGTLRPPEALAAPVRALIASRLRPKPRRAEELRRLGPGEPVRLWPSLRLVSCWGDGHAALYLDALRRVLPGVEIQPKGLLATEACVTIPFDGATPLAVRSHFFEFLEEGRPRLAHQVEPGGVYSVVVTTGGGLYRYCLEDRVQVTGFVRGTPSLAFLGKEGHCSDLVGEKLREDFVSTALARTLGGFGLEARLALLAPDTSGARPGYTLYLECDALPPSALAAALERALGEHPDYRYAVRLGQLRPARVFRIRADGWSFYVRRCQERGQRLGDVKPLALSLVPGWESIFPGACEPDQRTVAGR